MTPNHPDEPRLYELFVRYWDNTLAPAEVEELNGRLVADPDARGLFELFTLQAVAAAERPVAAGRSGPEPPPAAVAPAPLGEKGTGAGWTRRRALKYLGGGLVAGVGAVGLGRWLWPDPPDRRPRLIAARGTVTVRTPDGGEVEPTGPLPPRAVVSTHGLGSSVVITYIDGSTVALLGDSTASADDGGRRLVLSRGVATADIRRQPEGEGPAAPSLGTAQVLLPALSGTLLTLGRMAKATDVEVYAGQVSAAAPSGEQLAVVRAGELLTVEAGGDLRKRKISTTPDTFSLDLTRPLPEGWDVGFRRETPGGWVLRMEHWPDPYYNGTRMYQARSDQPWTRGMFRLAPDSRVRVKYRAAASGPGQVCFCVRTEQSRCSETGMLEYNGGFEATAPGAWRWIDVPAESLLALPNTHAPKFGAPWVGFSMIFNTFETDLGLEVAEFRVTPPEAAQ